MSDSRSQQSWHSTALPFTSDEINEFAARFEDHELYELEWPSEDDPEQ